MSKSQADIVAELRSSLAITEPNLDTSIGSVVRKILDVVAEQIAPAYAESYLSEYVYSVDTKSGADLDDFCAMFGIYRLPASRAVGVVTFSRPTAATENIQIADGTQLATGSTPQVIFATVAPAVLLKGTLSVSIPVQAVVAGASGNLPANSLTNLASSVSGVSSTTTQGDACIGGSDSESDDALKSRFKKTVFRSMAGTEDMFLALAIEDTTADDPLDAVASAGNVIGASKFWREQVQVESVGGQLIATSTIPPDAVKHVYSGSVVFGPDIDNGQILSENVQYTFDLAANPPQVVSVGSALDTELIYDLIYEYVPTASRNDPDNGITNRVDIWVSGVAAQQASETTYFNPQSFTSSTTSPLYNGKFIRLSDAGEVPPVSTNVFLQLAWGPIIDFPETLTINGTTYTRDVDYWVVHDDSAFGYSSTSLFGLEWVSTNQPINNSQVLLTDSASYFYNRLPADVEARARQWKLVTTDVKAHAAKAVRMRLNIAIMYSSNYDRGVVQAGVDSAMANWFNGLGFRSVVQVSDVLQAIHAVAGVDNVRFLNSLEPTLEDDADSWGVELVSSDGTFLSHFDDGGSPARPVDIVLAENQVPVLYSIRYETRAQNSFGEPR